MKNELAAKFCEIYGGSTEEVKEYFAPGRVNLIGEHTDYNGGHVFPCALTMGTYMVVRKREDKKLRFYSENFEHLGVLESGLDDLVCTKEHGWINYPLGVIWAFIGKGYNIDCGLDVAINGNIPNGSGLSSSASLEVVTGLMLKDQFGLDDVTMIEIAQIGQYSENNFNGMKCGIMDQFASAMGKKDCAIFLDTNTLHFEYAPVELKDNKIVITNSNVKHSLVNSAYNTRRSECEEALKQLQTVVDIKTLGDLTEEEFETYKDAIKDPVQQKRAKHAVYENQRTIKAVELLKKGDLEGFGKLMNASHVSLRDDYEVSCEEMDKLVEEIWSVPGVLGGRMTGAGFGGCAVSIVNEAAVENFIKQVGEKYFKETKLKADFYVADIGNGGTVLS